jgi:protein-tyrosine phosphatase
VICAWLIEEEGFSVKDALEAFRRARPDGIRHVRKGSESVGLTLDFISTLHRRYPGA